MITFSYRVSCLISVMDQPLLNRAFHYEKEKVNINESYNSTLAHLPIMEDKTLFAVFEPMISDYCSNYGIDRTHVSIDKFTCESGHRDITVSFYLSGTEKKVETTDSKYKVISFYHEDDILNHGLELKEYGSKLSNHTYALRIGQQVPEGDVNLAYVHVPRLDVDDNVSVIDTSSINENVIPYDQMTSIVVPDGNGKLSYADIISDDEPIVLRAPYDLFPSKNVNLTRRFMRNEHNIQNALFYKFEIKYHYDTQVGEAGKVTRYKGNQIMITDENGNLLDDRYKSMIFVRSMEDNPQIYWVKIYLQMNTDEHQTFKVRYNHVDQVVSSDQLSSSQRTVELYSNKDNANLIEGGKLRIINGVGAYEEAELADVRLASTSQEVYALEEKPELDGFHLYVPQKAEADPRKKEIFSFRVGVRCKDDQGNNHTMYTGYMTDWVINKEALLAHEQKDFDDSGKKAIGFKTGSGWMNPRQLMEQFMPLDMPSLPLEATYFIEDAEGNLLYTTESAPNKANVNTGIAAADQAPFAQGVGMNQQRWTGMDESNVRVMSNPIPHVCTIFPEKQETEWDFKWEAKGEGKIPSTTSYKGKWEVSADVTIMRENTATAHKVFTDWENIGPGSSVSDWKYNAATDELYFTKNLMETNGFYNGDAMDKKDYRFSAVVRVNDPNDDDVIGLMWRIQGENEYYMFAWERDDTMTKDSGDNGAGRVLVSNRGISAVQWNDDYPMMVDGQSMFQLLYDVNKYSGKKPAEQLTTESDYVNKRGFGLNKKRIFKAERSRLPDYNAANYPNCKYFSDTTDSSYADITDFDGRYVARGWKLGVAYRITVVVTGDTHKVYVTSDVANKDAIGELVCSAEDDDYDEGSYGIYNVSQRYASWSDLRFVEIESKKITKEYETVLTSNQEIKISSSTVQDLLQAEVDQYLQSQYGTNLPHSIDNYRAKSLSSDLKIRIRQDDYVWGYTNSSKAGGQIETPWKTEDNGMNIKGTGTVTLRADGSIHVEIAPQELGTDLIPAEVQNFEWTQIWQTDGDRVSLSIHTDGKTVVADAVEPPITPIGKPFTITADKLYKNDGMKQLGFLLGAGGILEKLSLPADVPLENVLLRIERGDINGTNKEFRVNYRFRYNNQGRIRYEVDQINQGVNRIRLRNILRPEDRTQFIAGIKVDLVAWTEFEDLDVVPILAIQLDDDKKIEVEKPKVEKKKMEIDNWYVRVKNGKVKKKLQLPYVELNERHPQLYTAYPELIPYMPKKPDEVVEVVLDYSIPEYKNQEFYNRPVMLVERETPVILNDRAIQTRYAPLVLSSETGISYLEVEALRINNSRKLRISDVDAKKGIIYLHDRIRENDEVIVRYAYKEDYFTYRGFERGSDFFHLDLNPSPGHRLTLAIYGNHTWIPIDTDAQTAGIVTTQSVELLVRQIHLYLRPTCIWLQTQTGLQLIDGTIKNQAVLHTNEGHWFDPDDYYYDPTMLRLAKLTVQANSDINKDMVILDTRTRGGGLDEALSREVISQVNKESLQHWDIGYFDGEAYQENGVFIIQLPRTILKEYGGRFHEAEVQAAVAKYKAYGNLPIIEYVDPTFKPDLNLLGNYEFFNGEHIKQYNETVSSGVYFIEESPEGTGDNYILKLKDSAVYGITVPGHSFKHYRYEFDVKAKLGSGSLPRSAGVVQVRYEDGTAESFQLAQVLDQEWAVYKVTQEFDKPVDRVDILVNHSGDDRTGLMMVDYVIMIPIYETDENMEVVEI